MDIRKIFLILILFFICHTIFSDNEYNRTDNPYDLLNIGRYYGSLCCPGWGQMGNEEYGKAVIHFLTFWAAFMIPLGVDYLLSTDKDIDNVPNYPVTLYFSISLCAAYAIYSANEAYYGMRNEKFSLTEEKGKREGLAGTLSLLIPGTGQFYNHDIKKGICHLTVGTLGWFCFIGLICMIVNASPEIEAQGDLLGHLMLGPIIIGPGLVILHVMSSYDAFKRAFRINKKIYMDSKL